MKKKQISKVSNFDTDELKTVKEVSRYFKVPVDEMLNNQRTMNVIVPRLILAYVLRNKHNLSFPAIGKRIGYTHATAISAVTRVEKTHWMKEQAEKLLT